MRASLCLLTLLAACGEEQPVNTIASCGEEFQVFISGEGWVEPGTNTEIIDFSPADDDNEIGEDKDPTDDKFDGHFIEVGPDGASLDIDFTDMKGNAAALTTMNELTWMWGADNVDYHEDQDPMPKVTFHAWISTSEDEEEWYLQGERGEDGRRVEDLEVTAIVPTAYNNVSGIHIEVTNVEETEYFLFLRDLEVVSPAESWEPTCPKE